MKYDIMINGSRSPRLLSNERIESARRIMLVGCGVYMVCENIGLVHLTVEDNSGYPIT